MKAIRFCCWAVVAALVGGPVAFAQEPPKPGPEHEVLKKMVGTWEATMKAGGADSKGTMVYKMDLGGMWLASTFEGDFGGMKFSGRGFSTYDSTKKKYVEIWIDSMSTGPMMMEGTFDKEKNTMTTTGEGPGMDGKPAKYKSVVVIKDADTMMMDMYMGDTKDPAFQISYKRKKGVGAGTAEAK